MTIQWSQVNLTADMFVWLQFTGYRMLTALLPQYLVHNSCIRHFNATICVDIAAYSEEQAFVQQDASFWLSITIIARFLPTCFTLMIWGSMIDRVGQHRGMLLPPVVLGVQAVLFLVCSSFPDSNPLYVVAVTFLSCFYGDISGLYVVTSAYIAGITTPRKRNQRMAIIQGESLLTDVIAGFLSGVALQELGFQAAFGIILSLSAINFVMMFCFAKPIILTPTPADEPVVPQRKSLNPWFHFKSSFKATLQSQYKNNFLIILAAFFFTLATTRGDLAISVMYITNAPFNFSPLYVGYYLGYVALIRGIGPWLFTKLVTKYIGGGDFALTVVGLAPLAVLMVLVGLSKSTLMLFLVSPLGATMFLAPTVFRGRVTKLVKDKDAGKAVSVLETVGLMCSLISGVLITNVYRLTLDFNAGYIYFILASFAVTALLISCVLAFLLRRGVLMDPLKDTPESAKGMVTDDEMGQSEMKAVA